MNKEQAAIERLRIGEQTAKTYYDAPLIVCYSGGKDSEVLLQLAINSGIDFEVSHNHTTADAPETVYHVRNTFKRLELQGIRKRKDQNGQYLWQPATGAETPDTLLNRPIYTSAYAPIIESDKCPIAFGDFNYYWIADRQGRIFRRLDELYARNGQVCFIASQRVDGKLILPEAVQVLKMGASEAA